METDTRIDDPAQADLAWVGYSPWAMAPALVLAAIANGLVIWGRWALDDLSAFADRVGALAVFALGWAVWPGLIAVLLYRTITYTYRLTDRALLIDFGFLARPVLPIALVDVVEVVAGGGWLARGLGVGWVEVRTADRAVRMTGIRNPTRFTEQIRAACAAVRTGPTH